jgi:hypothetical protein
VGKLAADIIQRGGEGIGARGIVGRSHLRVARLAGGEGQHGVAGGGVAESTVMQLNVRRSRPDSIPAERRLDRASVKI